MHKLIVLRVALLQLEISLAESRIIIVCRMLAQDSPEQVSGKSSLLNLVERALRRIQNHQELDSVKYSNEIVLKIIQRKPLYVTDGQVCIQASFTKVSHTLDPFNRGATPYYAPVPQKPHILFNCHDRDAPQEPTKYPSPYHPNFFFQNYDNFKKFRQQAKVLVSTETITVKDWSLSLVNVSASGYYAPVLVIHQFDKHKAPSRLDQPVQNILFCPSLQQPLEGFRSKDMRNKQLPKSTPKFSMAYYIRNEGSSEGASQKSPFVNLDMKKKILKFKELQPVNYVPVGSCEGFCLFKRPISNNLLTNEILKIDFNQMAALIEAESDKESQSQMGDMSLWSDDDVRQNQSSMSGDEREDQRPKGGNEMEQQERVEVVEIESDNEDSDDDDPLRSVYRKQINSHRDTFI